MASNIIIVGGGVIGLTAALALRQHGHAVTIVDAGDFNSILSEQLDLRVFAINPASQRLLTQLNIWPKLAAQRLSPYRHMHVWDNSTSAHLDFDINQTGQDRLGTIIEEAVLKAALIEAVEASGVTLCPQFTVTEVDTNSKYAQIGDGKTKLTAQLLIIADGANSPTRNLLKVALTQWPYHHTALIARVQHAKPHNQTAYQVFQPDGPLAFLPLVEAQQSSIVWSTSKQRAASLLALDEHQFATELSHAFASTLGPCHLLSARAHFPLHMRHTRQYCGERWLLMGDAAHTIHPLAGLGLNIGLADIATLIGILDQMPKSSRDLGASSWLARYQRQRKVAVWQVIALMDMLKVTFANPLPPIRFMRNYGLKAVNACLPLKRLFIDYASR